MLELKLGYTTEKSYYGSDDVIKYKFEYFHISNFTTDLAGNKNSSDLNTNSWRFGFGWASGYGYDLGNGLFNNTLPCNFNRLDPNGYADNSRCCR